MTGLRHTRLGNAARTAAAVSAVAYLAVWVALITTSTDPLSGVDAYTYWSVPYDDPYTGPDLGLQGAYLYPPAFLQALAPLRLLPWEVFQVVWAALGVAALTYLIGPVGAALAVTFLPFVQRDLLIGNIHLMLAGALVVSVRHPSAWAFPALTKVTPAVGALWFAGRREWRNLVIATGASLAIAAVSVAVTPELWFAWTNRMASDSGRAGDVYSALIVLRVMLAGAIAYLAGRTGRASFLPFAMLLALPILWPDSLAILLACFPLFTRERTLRRSDA